MIMSEAMINNVRIEKMQAAELVRQVELAYQDQCQHTYTSEHPPAFKLTASSVQQIFDNFKI